jgi:cell division protein FtsW
LLVIGIASWILVQAFINIGAVLGVMPITGVPLPFMSAGGTSLVTTLAGVGVMLNVARSAR